MKNFFLSPFFFALLLTSCATFLTELDRAQAECEAKGGLWIIAADLVEKGFCTDLPPAPKPPSPVEPPEPEPSTIFLAAGQEIVLENDGHAEFAIKGLGNFPVREFFLFDIAGDIAGGRTQSIHWLTYRYAGHFRIVEQAYKPTEETHHPHNFAFDPNQTYRMGLTWTLDRLLFEMFVDNRMVARVDARFKLPFTSINSVRLGNGVFPGYPGVPRLLEVVIRE